MWPSILLLTALLLSQHILVSADSEFAQWCGKYYEIGAPVLATRPDGSLFPYPPVSDQVLLDFRCVTASSLYLENDDVNDPPAILVDTNLTYDVGQAYYGGWSGEIQVEVYTDDWTPLTSGSVSLNKLGQTISFNTSTLKAQKMPYNLTCKGCIGGQEFWANSTLSYLPPNPYGGNTVKVDRRSGSLIVRNETSGSGWEKIIPFGFYDLYGGVSDDNTQNDTIARLYQAKALGYNLIHPVSPWTNTTPYPDFAAFEAWLDTAEMLGIWVMYDMRYTFTDLSSVTEQVEALRNRSNILLWYTGDEPDGGMNGLNSTRLVYDLIYELDGYHPVSLVLNCENYYYTEYGLDGADVLLHDPYPIALDGSWSKLYNTPTNETFGDGGCDNCKGSFYDITQRIDASRDRARVAGKWRTTPSWIVPQAFDDGQQEFWYRVPTGDEEAVTTILAFNHGAMGHCGWNSQYSTPDLLNNASFIAAQLYAAAPYIIGSADSRSTVYSNLSYPGINGVDLASWTLHNSTTNATETLVLVAYFTYIVSDSFTTFNLVNVSGTVKQVLFGNVTVADNGSALFSMPRTSVAGVILTNSG